MLSFYSLLFADPRWIKITFITRQVNRNVFTLLFKLAYLVKLDREDNTASVKLLRLCFENLCYYILLGFETTMLSALVTAHSKHSSSSFSMFMIASFYAMNS